MPLKAGEKLRELIAREVPHLRILTDDETAPRPAPGKWSRKEDLGHLIDSATNNHIRFVLAETTGEFRGLGYDQDSWVGVHGYADLSWSLLVELWHQYNWLLSHLVERIPAEHMNSRCVIGREVLTLGFVIEDYMAHMQHHLDHLLGRAAGAAWSAAPNSRIP